MAQVGRISGPLLYANLERNGIDLAFRNDLSTTQLLYLDVNTGIIGVNTSTPSQPLTVDGTFQSTNAISETATTLADLDIFDNTIRALVGDINLNAADAIVMANMENGTIRISDNVISTIVSNSNIDLTPHGTGTTEIVNNLNIFGDLYTPGNIDFGGNITFGNNLNDTVDFNADLTSDLIPDQTNTYSLGSSDNRWDTFYTNFINGQAVDASSITIGLIDINTRHAGKLYVGVSGLDTNVGDHPLGALATIKEALTRAEASGDQPFLIYVAPGEYQEALPLVVPSNVSIIGQDIRNVIVTPDTSSQSEDVFHLNDSATVANLTIRNHYYDSVNNTGYAFRFAPNATISNRSPYIQNVTVLTQETSNGAGDAGRGAWIDGAELNTLSPLATMLFHSCTFITPNADVINMTNGVRVEWLNSFTYYANRGLYAFAGTTGRTSEDGSTVNYGAELRSIGSANVYGNYGAVADGANTLMYLIQHNFGYIGAGTSNANIQEDVIQANEVVELNSGQIHYVSTDQLGNFRVGNNFFVNLEDGSTSLNINTGDIDALSGLIINSTGGTTVIDGSYITTGNIRISDNDIETVVGDLNLQGASGTINLNNNTTVRGSVNIVDNLSFGGTLNLAGNEPGRNTANDRLVFNVEFEQNFNPHRTLVHNLGEVERPWLNGYLNRLEVGDITVDDNYVTTDVSNADLEIVANGTGEIYILSNNVQVDTNVTVSGITTIANISLTGDIQTTGDIGISKPNEDANVTTTNLNISQDLDVSSQAQFEEILFDGNIITTTTSNADLELRANGTGIIYIPDNNVTISNNVTVNDIFNDNDIYINLQTQFNNANVDDVLITQNYITTTASNADLELRANQTGKIIVPSNDVRVENNLFVGKVTSLKDSVTTYEYGPELVNNGTFNSNLVGWDQVGGGTATATGGNLRINATGAARNVSQEVIVEPGKTYDFEAQFRSVSNSNPFYLRIFETGVGTLFEWNETSGLVNDQLLTASFVPAGTAIDIIFRAVDTIVQWDNVSMFEDIGFVTQYIPVQVNIDGNITQTGNRTQTGNITQTGNTDVVGELTVSNQFAKSNILFDENILQNTGEGLRLSTENSDPHSLPAIVQAIVGGATAADYAGQTEKNLINFLIDNNYVDVNSSGTLTTSDYLAYLQYVVNGQTNTPAYTEFVKAVVDEIITLEYATPGYFNSIIFDGDYYNPNLELVANGTGVVAMPTNNVHVSNDLFASSIVSGNINVNQDLELNEIVITDSIIEIDDNFISTTISNENLELRAEGNSLVRIPSADTLLEQNLTVDGNTFLKDLNIQGNITQTGIRNQVGDLNVVGTVTVTSTNIESEIQFENISFNDNYIETTDSNSNLELRANGTGKIILPDNDVKVNNNISLGTLNAVDININAAFGFEEFELSSDIQLFDNVITTTESNSNLELRTSDNSDIILQNILVNNNDIRTLTSDINLNPNSNLVVNSTAAIKLPAGTTVERQKIDSGIRFNSSDNVFEAFRNNKTITFNGVYSDNRRTSLLADTVNDTLTLTVNTENVATVSSVGITAHGLLVDDISVQNSTIRTTVSNSNLELHTNGTGELIIDNMSFKDNVITNTSNGSLTLANTLYGKNKFVGHSVRFPAGTTAERPTAPEVGTTRWNTETSVIEVWDGSTFIIASGSSATISQAEMDDLVLEYTLIFG